MAHRLSQRLSWSVAKRLAFQSEEHCLLGKTLRGGSRVSPVTCHDHLNTMASRSYSSGDAKTGGEGTSGSPRRVCWLHLTSEAVQPADHNSQPHPGTLCRI